MCNCACGFFFLIVQSCKQDLPGQPRKLRLIGHSLRHGAVWSSPSQQSRCLFSALECQGYIILSGACGIWPLRAKYHSPLRWLGARGCQERHVLLEGISSRDLTLRSRRGGSPSAGTEPPWVSPLPTGSSERVWEPPALSLKEQSVFGNKLWPQR